MSNTCLQGIVLDLWRNLLADLRNLTGDLTIGRRHEKLLEAFDFKGFRELPWPDYSRLGGVHFKALYQAENLLKRVILLHDAFTNEDLEDRAFAKFIATQALNFTGDSYLSSQNRKVLLRAREVISKILGTYDAQEHRARCSWGTKAAFQVSRKDGVLLENRLRRLSGSKEHCRWFVSMLVENSTLRHAVAQANGIPERVILKHLPLETTEVANLQFVPKSYKAKRLISPDKTIGGFYTSGLGKMIRVRLQRVGLDIETLQKRHQRIACEASRKGHLVTADLSSASDLISAAHLQYLLPEDWQRAVLYGRDMTYRYERKDGTVLEGPLTSVMLMGNGHTFDLQTLVFYSVLKALQLEYAVPGLVSVYGDDMIYPKQLHGYVEDFFSAIHWKLNRDKTFSTGTFRESCGGDFTAGLNVRPFNPQLDMNAPKDAPGFLYTALNTLLDRWDPWEVPRAVRCLLKHVIVQTGSIVIVPAHYSTSSGLCTGRTNREGLALDNAWWHHVVPITGYFNTWNPSTDSVTVESGSVLLYEWLRKRQVALELGDSFQRCASYDVRKMHPAAARAYLIRTLHEPEEGAKYCYTWHSPGGKRHVETHSASSITERHLLALYRLQTWSNSDVEKPLPGVNQDAGRVLQWMASNSPHKGGHGGRRRRVVGCSVEVPRYILETRRAEYGLTGLSTLDAEI